MKEYNIPLSIQGMAHYETMVTAVTLSTEFFVLIIFVVGAPFFYSLLRDSDIHGWGYFFLAYVLLTFSNVFTVIEEFWYNAFFNLCEHTFIAFASITLLVAVFKFLKKKK